MTLLFPIDFSFFSNKCSLQGCLRSDSLQSFREYGSVFRIGLWSSFVLKLFNYFTMYTKFVEFWLTQRLYSFSLSSTGIFLFHISLFQCLFFLTNDLLKITHKREWQVIYKNVGNISIVKLLRKHPGSLLVLFNCPDPYWELGFNQPLPHVR